MPRKRSAKSDTKDDFPLQLVLAENWVKRLGKPVSRIEVGVNEIKQPALEIGHKDRPIFIRTHKDLISIFVIIEISEEVREDFTKLDPPTQEKILMLLKHQLLSQPRSAYMIKPPDAGLISEIYRIVFEQIIYISTTEYGSFNRFSGGGRNLFIYRRVQKSTRHKKTAIKIRGHRILSYGCRRYDR